MNPADRECVGRAQSGDAEALADLFDRYGALLHPLALRILDDPAEADEVLFDVWLQVVRKSVTLPPRRGVASWMVSLVRERAIERRRSGRRVSNGEPYEDGPVEVMLERMDLADRAAEALALFDDHERQVLELAFYEGLTYQECAQKIGVNVREVRAWMRQAFERLRDALPAEEAA
jgi:RNA polymerase sigma-70 factor (ECF subfamily)